MDKEQTSFKNTSLYYWLVLIIWPSIKVSLSFSKIKEKAIDIVISAAIGLVLVLVFDTPETTTFPELLVTFLSWLCITFFVRLASNVYSLPSRMNKEKENRIKELEAVDANIEISVPEEVFGQDDKVRIIITNKNKTANIEKCFARFEYIGILSAMGGQFYLYKFGKQYYQKNILWNRKSAEDGTITIAADGNEVLDAIQITDVGFDFLFQDLEKYSQSFSRNSLRPFDDYLVLLKIYGTLSGHPIKDSQEYYTIHFEFLPTIEHIQKSNSSDSIPYKPRLVIKKVELLEKAKIKEYKGAEIRVI